MPSRDIFCNSIDFNIYRINSIPSTNTYFKENYNKYSDMSVLIANEQTNGRGRFLRQWESKNDICFSILFKEKHPNAIIAPLSIVLALNDLGISSGIKWPNDIYLDDKKLSGILIEEIYESTFVASVVGIGINIDDKPHYNGIGLAKYITTSKHKIIEIILHHYKRLINISMTDLIKLYKENSIILNKKIIYKEKIYLAIDITENGYLVLNDNYNNIITISSDEINIKSAIID